MEYLRMFNSLFLTHFSQNKCNLIYDTENNLNLISSIVYM